MATPRSESISRARHEQLTPMADPSDDPARNKIDHYAGLARVIHETHEKFVANPASIERLQMSMSTASLRRSFADMLVAQTQAVIESEDFATLHGLLQSSQTARLKTDPLVWQRVEQSLAAGAHTFVNTTEAVYDALEALSHDIADAPESAAVLERLARLSITQFIPYRDVYLEKVSNIHLFHSHLERHGAGVRFRRGFPFDARVPRILTDSHRSIGVSEDYELENNELITLGDIPAERAAIGCPITFYKNQVPELWVMYTNARISLRQRRKLGNQAANSGDTAASHQATL